MAQITGADIASEALKYQGAPYVWAGATPSGWDCSGFVGYVLGCKFGLKLPLGFTGSAACRTHGPPAAAYKTWSAAKTVTAAEPGDLCVWLTHIGIAIGGTQMISALNPSLGTVVSSIQGAGPPGEPLSIRAINTVAASTGSVSGGSSGAGCTAAMILAPILIVKGVLLGHHREAQPEG